MRAYIGQGIPTYTIFSTMGLFFMMMVIYLRNKIFDFLEYLEFIAILAIGAGIGSKVLFIITQIPDIVEHFSLRYMCYKVVTSGFVFYGGLIGAIEGTILFAHIKQLPKKEVLQLATPGYSIFHAVGRIGCFFAGCCYGKVTSWGFALWNEPGVKRIPVQLIESVYLFILTIILLKNENKWRDKIFEVYMVSYAMFRFVIEFFRGDSIRGIWGCFSTSQWIAILIVILFLDREIKKWRKNI